MKTKISKLLLIAFLSLFCSLSIASTKEDNLNKLFVLSGITKQISQFPGQIKLGFMQAVQQGASIPQNEVSLILKSVDKTIQPSVILAEMRHSLNQSLSNKEIETLLKWYESDIGKKITDAEKKASTPEAFQQMQNAAQQLLANTKRVEVATRLDTLLNTTDMAMEIQRTSSIAVYSSIMTALAPDQELNLDTYKAQMTAIEPQIRAQLHQLILMSFIYSYQNIDDNSLATYEAFLNRPITQKFNNSTIKGLNKGLTTVVSNWADELAIILKNKINQQHKSGT